MCLKLKTIRAQVTVDPIVLKFTWFHQESSYASTTVANALATLVAEVVMIVFHARTSTCTGTLITVYMFLTRTYTSSVS